MYNVKYLIFLFVILLFTHVSEEEALKGMRKAKNELENSQSTPISSRNMSHFWNEKLQVNFIIIKYISPCNSILILNI